MLDDHLADDILPNSIRTTVAQGMKDAAALAASPRRRNRKPVCRRRSGPRLSGAEPPVGGTVAASPTEIRLFFIEAIEPRFSGIELATIDGRPVKTGPAVVEPRDPMEYVLPLHSVRWQNRIKLPKGSITSVSSIPQGIAVSGYVTPGYFNAPKAQFEANRFNHAGPAKNTFTFAIFC